MYTNLYTVVHQVSIYLHTSIILCTCRILLIKNLNNSRVAPKAGTGSRGHTPEGMVLLQPHTLRLLHANRALFFFIVHHYPPPHNEGWGAPAQTRGRPKTCTVLYGCLGYNRETASHEEPRVTQVRPVYYRKSILHRTQKIPQILSKAFSIRSSFYTPWRDLSSPTTQEST